ncbi:MAG: response regulator transcription factor [Flavobacteriales bacterium]|nr:response regulator transcription factor [Flavobacteriales bacterium]MBP6696508.1 response regulator transcription factor [Flavobacteriales bacterium]
MADDVPVALVDDHTLVRKGLAELIHGIGGYRVVLEAGNGEEFTRAVSGGPSFAVAIVDLNMPVMDGFETIAWARTHLPEVRCLALTFEGSEKAIVRAIRSGARGFVLKDIEPDELKLALDRIHLTGYYHTEMVQQGLLNSGGPATVFERERAKVLAKITPREMEFLHLLTDPNEYTYEGICELMEVHRSTLNGYRGSLFHKFGVHSKTGLVVFAVHWGLVKV